ncbi:hypothetical protein D9M70_627940 [compost metagenome]
MPFCPKRSAVCADLAIVPISWFSRSTMAAGVFAGSTIPNQPDVSSPGNPASAAVGTSGSSGERCALVSARPRTLPPWICGARMVGVSTATSTSPPSSAVMAGALPL